MFDLAAAQPGLGRRSSRPGYSLRLHITVMLAMLAPRNHVTDMQLVTALESQTPWSALLEANVHKHDSSHGYSVCHPS